MNFKKMFKGFFNMRKKNSDKKKVVHGYKAFNSDLTCLGFQYEVGKTYTLDESKEKLKLCKHGFHFCTKLRDSFWSYNDDDSRFCEVKATGEVVFGKKNSKVVTNKITIVKELLFNEFTEEEKIKLVLDAPWFTTYIKNPSIEVQKACLDYISGIPYIKVPLSYKMQKYAIRHNPHSIKEICAPSLELQLMAVGDDWFCIYLIEKPHIKAQRLAVKKNESAINFIYNPPQEILDLHYEIHGYESYED